MHKQAALYVISTIGGGTPATNFDLMRAVRATYRTLLLISDSSVVRLIDVTDSGCSVISSHILKTKIDPLVHTSEEYDKLVAAWLNLHRVTIVHIRHLAWHSLNLPSIARRMNIPCLLSLHDYYMICPTVKLLDAEGRYCGGKCGSGDECQQELWPEDSIPQLRNRYIHLWQRRSEKVIESCDAAVVTTKFAAELFTKIFPSISRKMHVIPHGRDFHLEMSPLALSCRRGDVLRVVFSNINSYAKGAALVSEVCRLAPSDLFEFHILGDWDKNFPIQNAVLHGAYRRDDLQQIIASIRPDVGVIPSLWPETFCHVLTEMWACGLPVLAMETGALAERLSEQGGGWLYEAADPELLLGALEQLRRHPAEIARERAVVYGLQRTHLAEQSVSAMANNYLRLYRQFSESTLS